MMLWGFPQNLEGSKKWLFDDKHKNVVPLGFFSTSIML
jgi:hypothetical protein